MKSGLLEKTTTETLPNDYVIEKWKSAVDKFAQEISKFYFSNDIILQKFLCLKNIVVSGKTSATLGGKLEFAQFHKTRLNHYYEYIEKTLQGINVVELLFGSYYADKNHR